jgi:hypothetical protein
VVGSYEHNSEPSGSIKYGQIVNSGATVSLSRTLLHGAVRGDVVSGLFMFCDAILFLWPLLICSESNSARK